MDNKTHLESGSMKASAPHIMAVHNEEQPKKWQGLVMLLVTIVLIATVLSLLDGFFQSQK